MMRRAVWRNVCPPMVVAVVMVMLAVDAEVGWPRTLLYVALPAVLLAGTCWLVHARRLRRVGRIADAGIRSLELWLAEQGRGRRS